MLKKCLFVFCLILTQLNFAVYAVENIKISGEIETVVEDYFPEDSSFTKHYLNVDKGKYANQQIEINFDAKTMQELNSGDQVEIVGYFVEKNFFKVLQFTSIVKTGNSFSFRNTQGCVF